MRVLLPDTECNQLDAYIPLLPIHLCLVKYILKSTPTADQRLD